MGRYELTIEGEFSAAHRLRLYDGTFEPLHGHNWRVAAYYGAAGLDEIGVAADFCVLQRQLADETAKLHDAYLNEFAALGGKNPTTEHVAQYLFKQLAPAAPRGVKLRCVRVWETARCAAAYAEDEAQVGPES